MLRISHILYNSSPVAAVVTAQNTTQLERCEAVLKDLQKEIQELRQEIKELKTSPQRVEILHKQDLKPQDMTPRLPSRKTVIYTAAAVMLAGESLYQRAQAQLEEVPVPSILESGIGNFD